MNSTDFELLCKNGDISIINYNEYVKSNCEDKKQSKMTKSMTVIIIKKDWLLG